MEELLPEEQIEPYIPAELRNFLVKIFEARLAAHRSGGAAEWFEVAGGLHKETSEVRDTVLSLAPEWEGEPEELLAAARSIAALEKEAAPAG